MKKAYFPAGNNYWCSLHPNNQNDDSSTYIVCQQRGKRGTSRHLSYRYYLNSTPSSKLLKVSTTAGLLLPLQQGLQQQPAADGDGSTPLQLRQKHLQPQQYLSTNLDIKYIRVYVI